MAVNINGDTGIDKVQPGSVDGVDLTDGSVTEGKIGTGAVTADKIGSGAVTSAKLDANISVPGTVTATSFSGDGSSLTGIAGGFSNMEVFTSPGTWTNPGNVTKVKVTVVGGGGGGGGGPSPANIKHGGPGGAAGGTSIEVISFPSATNVPVTRGGGGTGGPQPVGGNSGGTSSFGSYCSATGGQGGRGSFPGNPASGWGSLGGIGSGGNLNLRGGSGTTGYREMSSPTYYFVCGKGGDSYLSAGGRDSVATSNGPGIAAGQAGHLGSGGGGAGKGAQTNSNANAGSGGAGVVIVEY